MQFYSRFRNGSLSSLDYFIVEHTKNLAQTLYELFLNEMLYTVVHVNSYMYENHFTIYRSKK